jgi:hypothetical protein
MKARRGAYMVLLRKPEERKHFEDPDIDGRILLKCIFEKWDRSVDSIDLAENRDRWRAVVNAVMNFRVPKVLTFLSPLGDHYIYITPIATVTDIATTVITITKLHHHTSPYTHILPFRLHNQHRIQHYHRSNHHILIKRYYRLNCRNHQYNNIAKNNLQNRWLLFS